MAKKVKKRVENKSNYIPVGVKTLSILFYISCALSFIFGFIILIVGIIKPDLISSKLSDPALVKQFIESGATSQEIASLPQILFMLLIIFGVFLICKAVLDFFIARGLWKKQKWSRIAAIIIGVIVFLASFVNLFQGDLSSIISLIVSGVVTGYLLFSEEVKKYFK